MNGVNALTKSLKPTGFLKGVFDATPENLLSLYFHMVIYGTASVFEPADTDRPIV